MDIRLFNRLIDYNNNHIYKLLNIEVTKLLRNIRWMSVGLFLVWLVGCNTANGDSSNNQGAEMPAVIEVQIQTSSEKPAVGEEVKIEAFVTQAGDAVDDASDVSFEVWEANSEDHEMIVGKHGGEGNYFTNKVFETDGKYTIVAHITARDQHTMPKIELLVGNITEETAHDQSQHDHSHAEGKLSIDIKLPDEIIVNESLPLEVTVIHEGATLTDAKVRFEIWAEAATRHEFIDTEEKQLGVYTSSFEFKKSGKHQLVVHIQNDTLHEHIERIVDVIQ